jgi:hypothetical protein
LVHNYTNTIFFQEQVASVRNTTVAVDSDLGRTALENHVSRLIW